MVKSQNTTSPNQLKASSRLTWGFFFMETNEQNDINVDELMRFQWRDCLGRCLLR
jgi:hypothetical protein